MENKIETEIQKGLPSNKFNVSVTDKRLVFKTISDYEKIVNEPSEITKMKFLQKVKSLKGFTSFAQKQNSSSVLSKNSDNLRNLIKDDYFASILNSDLAVQIGSNIFKINPVTEKVYMLPVKNVDQYKDLISENTKNINIRIFSTGDDILDIINSERKISICTQSGIGSYHSFTGVANVGVYQISGHLYFKRYGIYFSLFAEAVASHSGFVEVTTELAPVYYHVKCGNTVGPYNLTDGYGNFSTLKRYQSYQGSKNLNKVYFRARFQGKFTYPTSPPPLKNPPPIINNTPWIQIRVNY